MFLYERFFLIYLLYKSTQLCLIYISIIINMLMHLRSILFIFVTLLLINPNQAVTANTYVVERITPFDMPTNDLKLAVQKQLSHNDFLTSSFNTNRVDVSKLVYKATYNGQGRIIDPPYQSYKHSVSGDSIDVNVTYHAVVHPKLTPKASYDGITTLKIYLNYTKEIDVQSGLTKITNLKTLVDPASFHINYSKKPSPSDKQHLDYINNASMQETSDTTIYSLLQNQEFSSTITLKYFNQNIVNQRLSPTYESSYQYQYSNLNVTFDMATAKIENIEHGVANSMRGIIKNYNFPYATYPEAATQLYAGSDYHTLFSIGFIKNFISYNIDQNKDWKGYYVDRKRFPSRQFGFRLVDLEFIVNDFSKKYSQYYLNDILFTCNPLTFKNIINDEQTNKFDLDLTWSCKSGIVGISPSPTVLDFDVTFSHRVIVGLNGNYLTVQIEESKLKDWLFREVDGITVLDQQIAAFHFEDYARYLRGITVGTNFKVREGSSKVAFNVDEGLWIG